MSENGLQRIKQQATDYSRTLSAAAGMSSAVAPGLGLAASGLSAGLSRNGGNPKSFSPKKKDKEEKQGLIGESVGLGGKNDPEDVEAVVFHLLENKLIKFNPFEYSGKKQSYLNEVIIAYQKGIGFNKPDGRIDPGGTTERNLLTLNKVQIESFAKSATNKRSVPETNERGLSWIYAPLLGPQDYISQAPPSKANGVKTLTKDQLFSFALKKYGPGGSCDIKNPKNWPKHFRYKKGGINSYEKALEATYLIACHNASIYMAKNGGVQGISKNSGWDQKIKVSSEMGITMESLIDAQLAEGKVVVVRVGGHTIIIVGKGQDSIGKFYYYFDPGRFSKAGHDLATNRLYISDHKISGGDKNYRTYQVTSVRESIKQS